MKKKLQKRMKITCKIDDNVDSDTSNPHPKNNKIHETLRLANYVDFCKKCPPTMVTPGSLPLFGPLLSSYGAPLYAN